MFKDNKDIFQILSDAVSEGIIIVDADQNIVSTNISADNMFGYLVDDSGDYGVNRNYISPLINIGMSIDQIMSEATNYNRMSDVIEYNHNYVDYILALPTLEETIQSMHSNR